MQRLGWNEESQLTFHGCYSILCGVLIPLTSNKTAKFTMLLNTILCGVLENYGNLVWEMFVKTNLHVCHLLSVPFICVRLYYCPVKPPKHCMILWKT